MNKINKSFSDCLKKQMNDFTRYDQTVDVISGLEAFFDYIYDDKLKYFDRFPEIPPEGLTPDLTVLFKNNYGIVFEIKRTFPKDDVGFSKEIHQLLSYDGSVSFRSDKKGNRIVPYVYDIVLLINSSDSNEIFSRLNRLFDDKDIKFNNNLILMDYNYESADTESKYIIKTYAGNNKTFRDNFSSNSLDKILGEQAKSIKCYPRHFMKYKVNEVLCNDEPSTLYLAVYFWSKIFYNYLSKEQKETWRIGKTQTISDISLNIETLQNDLNSKYIPNGNIRLNWIRKTIKFLEVADLVNFIDDMNFNIRFRNLNKRIDFSDGEDEKLKTKELGHILANRYCENLIIREKPKKIRKHIDKKLKPTTLSEFQIK